MKNNLFKTSLQVIITVCFAFGSAIAISAPEENQKVAKVYFDNTVLDFEYKGNFKRAMVKVTGPRFFRANIYKKSGSPSIDLSQFGELDDGLYRYQILVATDKTIKLRKNRLDNGRGKNRRNTISVTEVQSGTFRMKGGSIITPSNETEGKGELK